MGKIRKTVAVNLDKNKCHPFIAQKCLAVHAL